MIGIDTNILVRYLFSDDEAQHQLACRTIDALTPVEQGYISLPVLLETIWLLRRTYHVGRESVRQAIAALVRSPQLLIHEADAINEALDLAASADHDLPDVIITVLGRRAGCGTTVTFDKAAARLPGMKLLVAAPESS
ncbi:MAG: type II toxin-antitoxin system VapC family toxin [Propionibacteriaceae bacterium]|jgi:predicted nucleic-acid-binding protein|nr:type II toxin-antitoxin system VapC family toxin [Propionibacteriaceae bacterium]